MLGAGSRSLAHFCRRRRPRRRAPRRVANASSPSPASHRPASQGCAARRPRRGRVCGVRRAAAGDDHQLGGRPGGQVYAGVRPPLKLVGWEPHRARRRARVIARAPGQPGRGRRVRVTSRTGFFRGSNLPPARTLRGRCLRRGPRPTPALCQGCMAAARPQTLTYLHCFFRAAGPPAPLLEPATGAPRTHASGRVRARPGHRCCALAARSLHRPPPRGARRGRRGCKRARGGPGAGCPCQGTADDTL